MAAGEVTHKPVRSTLSDSEVLSRKDVAEAVDKTKVILE